MSEFSTGKFDPEDVQAWLELGAALQDSSRPDLMNVLGVKLEFSGAPDNDGSVIVRHPDGTVEFKEGEQ